MNDDEKSYLKQLKDIKFIMFDICRCTIDGLPKAFDEIKQSLERLEKLEKVFEILKDKGVVEIEKYTNIGSVIYKVYGYERYLEQEEAELLEELMKDE